MWMQTQSTSRLTAFILVALVVAAVLAGCAAGAGEPGEERGAGEGQAGEAAGGAPDDAVEPAPELTRVRFAQAGVGATFAAVYVAQEKGFFREEGIDAGSPADIPSLGGSVIDALLAGDVDFGMGDALGVVAAHGKGATGAVIIGQFVNPTARQLVISSDFAAERGLRPDQPLAERMAGMKGATIGVLSPTGTTAILLGLIRSTGGLAAEDLDVVTLNGPVAMYAALGRRIDAFMWNPPFGPQAERDGMGLVLASVTEFPEYDFPELVLTTRRELLAEQPEVAAAVVRAIRRGEEFVRDRPDEAVEVLQPIFRDVDPEVLRETLDLLVPVYPFGQPMTASEWEQFIRLLEAYAGMDVRVDAAEGGFWTNEILEKAAR